MTSGNSALLGLAQGTVTSRETRGSSISKSPLTPLPRERVESVHPVLCLFSALPPPWEPSHYVKDGSTSRSQFSCWTRVPLYVIMGRRRLFVKVGHINSNLRTRCSCQQGSTATVAMTKETNLACSCLRPHQWQGAGRHYCPLRPPSLPFVLPVIKEVGVLCQHGPDFFLLFEAA